jgi:hypothetical protein
MAENPAPAITVTAPARPPDPLHDGLRAPRVLAARDRPDVEARSCECYQVVKTEFDRLLPYVAK